MMKKGTLTGVGIGPGDPELLTLKAVRLIREADVIAVPGTEKTQTVAYQITVQAVPELAEKEFLEIAWPMTKDAAILQKSHEAAAKKIADVLDTGRNVVFLTLGDVTIYSTYLYVHELLMDWGYEVQIANGIPSFCAVAARLNMALVMNNEELHIIPASYQIKDALRLPGTKVFMKAGRKMKEMKAMLLEDRAEAVMIENCGMPRERIYRSVEEIPEDAGYYSLIIVRR